MYQSPLCLLLALCDVLRVCLGIEYRAADVQSRNSHARQNTCDVKLAAVDQIHHDAQDAEYSHDCAPYDEPACFFAALAVLDAFDSGDQLANPSDQCQKQCCQVNSIKSLPALYASGFSILPPSRIRLSIKYRYSHTPASAISATADTTISATFNALLTSVPCCRTDPCTHGKNSGEPVRSYRPPAPP